SRLGDLVAKWLGGPPARAGFAYTARLMRRDFAFRRQLIAVFPSLLSPLILIVQGVRTDPFSGSFSLIHATPHAFGIGLFFIAVSIVYGGDFKGAWIFQLVPSGAFLPFARGVHALLWTSVIGLPHAILFIPVVWFWGIGHALLFLVYSLAVASFYL